MYLGRYETPDSGPTVRPDAILTYLHGIEPGTAEVRLVILIEYYTDKVYERALSVYVTFPVPVSVPARSHLIRL